MASLIRLAPINLNERHWQQAIRRLALTTPEGRAIAYQGEVLEATLSEGHTIEFAFQTHPLRPVALSLPLVVTTAAVVKVSVNGRIVDTITLAAPKQGSTVLLTLVRDLTSESESHQSSRLELEFIYQEATGSIAILLSDEDVELAPVVRQVKRPGYELSAWLFFIAAWGILLGLAIWGIAVYVKIGELTSRLLLVSSAVLLWVSSLCGLPDFAHIPIRAGMRRLYAWTRHYRFVWIVVLWLALVPVLFLAGTVVHSLIQRQQYTRLIERALTREGSVEQDALIRAAFIKLPWRREAQVLFERRAYSQRNRVDHSVFQNYVRSFTSDSGVRNVVQRLPSEAPLCLVPGGATSDPVTWYATLLLETENNGDQRRLEEAISLLKTRASAEATLYRLTFQLGLIYQRLQAYQQTQQDALYQETAAQFAQTVTQLRQELTSATQYQLVGFHSYQMACDALACYWLFQEKSADATYWFQKELETRRNQSLNGKQNLIWLRPAEKLMLYHMFVTDGGKSVMSGNKAEQSAVELLHYCSDFEQNFNKNFLALYPEYKEKKTWLQGTVEDEQAIAVIKELLNQDWRY